MQLKGDKQQHWPLQRDSTGRLHNANRKLAQLQLLPALMQRGDSGPFGEWQAERREKRQPGRQHYASKHHWPEKKEVSL